MLMWKKGETKMTDQFSRYEQDLIEIIRAAKTKLADQIPIAERGIRYFAPLYYSNWIKWLKPTVYLRGKEDID